MIVSAQHRNARISPYKARLVADALRGMPVPDAAMALKFSSLKGAALFRKLLSSAVANAENNNNEPDIDRFYIARVYVDEGMKMKRFSPRAKGRADRIIKRNSHLTLVLDRSGQRGRR